MRSAPSLGCRFLRWPISLAGLLAIGVLAPLLLPRPTYATSGTTRLPERPCPDLSQNLSYGRAGGSAVPDGRGGAFVAWADDREVSVMRFDPEGRSAPRWPGGGLSLGGIAPGGEGYQFSLAGDDAGGALLTWIGRHGEVRLQRVLPDCGIALGWPAEGLVLCDLVGTGRFPAVAITGSGAAVVAWREQELNGTQSIRLGRALLSGAVAPGWPKDGVALATGPGLGELASVCEVIPDGLGGSLVSWRKSGEAENRWALILQRVSRDGRVAHGWPIGGRIVATLVLAGGNPDESAEHPALAADGKGGAFLVWSTGRRSGAEQYDVDLLAQRMTGDGRIASGWPSEGKHVAAGGNQHSAVIASYQAGLLIAWNDNSLQDKIRIARLDATGDLRPWGGSQPVTSVERLAIVPGSRDRAFVAWTSEASTRPSLVLWGAGGNAERIETAGSDSGSGWDPTRLGLVSDGRGGALMIWQDWNREGAAERSTVRVSTASAAARALRR